MVEWGWKPRRIDSGSAATAELLKFGRSFRAKIKSPEVVLGSFVSASSSL
jgi:hypothetical protein